MSNLTQRVMDGLNDLFAREVPEWKVSNVHVSRSHHGINGEWEEHVQVVVNLRPLPLPAYRHLPADDTEGGAL